MNTQGGSRNVSAAMAAAADRIEYADMTARDAYGYGSPLSVIIQKLGEARNAVAAARNAADAHPASDAPRTSPASIGADAWNAALQIERAAAAALNAAGSAETLSRAAAREMQTAARELADALIHARAARDMLVRLHG